MLHDTLKQAMKTKLDPVIVEIEYFEHKGQKRQQIKAMKAKGKNIFRVVLYENGKYSDAA